VAPSGPFYGKSVAFNAFRLTATCGMQIAYAIAVYRMSITGSGIERGLNAIQQSISSGDSSAQMDSQLLQRMMEPAFYPHPCQSIESKQTLTAWLLFAGDFVYKVKKPVHFSFVDARTPAKCYQLCHDEVLLNRRLVPDIYLGVAGIIERSEGYVLVPNATFSEPHVHEFAIVMRRLPSERMLSQMIASGTIEVAEIKQLADKLATFHRNCSIAKSKTWGSAPALSRLIATTIADTERLIADTVMSERLAAATRYLRSYVINHQQLLTNRARNGRVRDGHGDLRADSICLTPPTLEIIGCAAYSEGLRYCDAASELASVMVDLERAERNDLADALVQAYIAATDDAELAELLSFYKCYRALRRGQMEMLISLQTEMPRERRMLARNYAGEWFQLAERAAAAATWS
jgi:aminoglycoside phosphotransferase family enzyme